MFWYLFIAMIACAAITTGPASSVASACPMCKSANESDDTNALPRAYMYSILFMLSVPATLFTGFGIGFYRLSKSGQNAADPDSSEGSSDSRDLSSPGD